MTGERAYWSGYGTKLGANEKMPVAVDQLTGLPGSAGRRNVRLNSRASVK